MVWVLSHLGKSCLPPTVHRCHVYQFVFSADAGNFVRVGNGLSRVLFRRGLHGAAVSVSPNFSRLRPLFLVRPIPPMTMLRGSFCVPCRCREFRSCRKRIVARAFSPRSPWRCGFGLADFFLPPLFIPGTSHPTDDHAAGLILWTHAGFSFA